MDEQRARKILGAVVQADGTLLPATVAGRVTGLGVNWPGFRKNGRLDKGVVWINDTDVTADQLEAIAWWIRNKPK